MTKTAVRRVLTLAGLTLREARRRRTAIAAIALGIVFLALFLTGFSFMHREIKDSGMPEPQVRFGYHFLVMAGFYVIHFLTVMLTILSSSGTLSSEIASHTIQTVVTKPVRRADVVVGKWLGHAAMILLYLGMLAGGLTAGVYVQSGFVPPNLIHAVALLGLEALVLLSLSLWGGTRLSTVANGVILFLIYGVAFIGAWIGQLGALFQSTSAIRIGTISSLLLPVEGLWRRAGFLMQPDLLNQLPVSPFTGGAAPDPRIEVYAVLYVAAALALAVRSFAKRDL